MEDNELQELFAAKRTTEANRRRQEELRRLIEAQSASRTRRLWPIWSGVAAAAVALLLLVRPLMQCPNESTAPTLVAQAKTPTPSESTMPKEEPTQPVVHITSSSTTSQTILDTTPLPEPSPQVEPVEEPVIEELVAPTEAERQPVAPKHRVMRRQSTLLACTEGCKAPESSDERKTGSVQINFFSNDQYVDATIYTFEIKK